MRQEILAVLVVALLVAVLVAASLGASYFTGAGGRQTVTTTSVRNMTSTATVATTLATTYTTTVYSQTTTERLGTPIPIASVMTGNTSIGGGPYTIAVDPGNDRVYVAGTTNILTVVDAVSHDVVARVTLPNSSNAGIAIDYGTGMVYVLVQGGVAEVNGTSDAVVKELPADFGFRSIAFDTATDVIYGSPETIATTPPAGSLLGIDPMTGAIIANVSIGYWASDIVINPQINMIYAAGCVMQGLSCYPMVSVVNGTSEKVVKVVHLSPPAYETDSINEQTGSVYVSGENQLVALDRFGNVTFNEYPDTCGPFISMASDTSLNQVIMAPQNYNYLLAYDGDYGNLLNMYSLPGPPQYVAFNPSTNETYVLVSESLLAFHDAAGAGHVNDALIGADQSCGTP
jgi:hypothetical protein